jgi:hypothetical protein
MAGPSPDPDRPREFGAAVEAVEDLAEVVRRDARAVVADDDLALPHGHLHHAAGREMAPRPLDRLGDQHVEPHVLDGHVALLVAGELDHVADQRSQLLGLLHHVGEQRASLGGRQVVAVEQDFRVRAQRRHRRAQLVRRVRDELPLRGPLEYRAVARGRPGPASAPTLSCVAGTMTGTTASLAAA